MLEFDIEIAPCSYMAFFVYEDRPGMIGKVGTVLGQHDINIASLQVGSSKVAGNAGMGLCLDSPIPPEVLGELDSLPGIKQAMFIVL